MRVFVALTDAGELDPMAVIHKFTFSNDPMMAVADSWEGITQMTNQYKGFFHFIFELNVPGFNYENRWRYINDAWELWPD